ncbi:CotH kinase family protein [Bacillus sp. Marseille-P3661]|uniref:CotH kinase family protein n=1 Tax=Bacillus sp. Marseille-P3661 TaxID=1936234 RepID=UPI000C86841D|nr:CotH kinase family protein [Bacillus sp. Marseille-P3661]
MGVRLDQTEKNNEVANVEENSEIERNPEKLVEDKRIYRFGEEGELTHFYVTILSNESTSENNITFYEMNKWYQFNSVETSSPQLAVILEEGDETGPKAGALGYGSSQANATISIRGASSRIAAQKSYKIKLRDSAGLWNGQQVLNLNKHISDQTRVKNKLSFDYFRLFPDLPSLRTNFVHLHVKDLTKMPPDNSFKSMGLFTHIEQVNKRYLAAHGLNPYGNLYKIESFEFFRYPEQLKVVDDPGYDVSQFERIMEIKGDNDHTELLKMLDAVNDLTKNINDVVSEYFERDNYLTWLAVNFIFGNVDTLSQNYYLYRPLNSTKWYFIPWDYDKAWDWHEYKSVPQWQMGLSRYWGNVLHRRFLRDPANIVALQQKIEQLNQIVTEEQTKEYLDSYYTTIKPIIEIQPDVTYLPVETAAFDERYYQLVKQPAENIQTFNKLLEYPTPIFLQAIIEDEIIRFSWDLSFDFQGDDLDYSLQISTDPDFTEIIYEKKSLQQTNFEMQNLEVGRYFWRVLVSDSKGHVQIPFEIYIDQDENYYWGLKELVIK